MQQYEEELQQAEREQAREDEERWQRHCAAVAQEEDDAAMSQAMSSAPKRLKRLVQITVKGRDGRELGTMEQEVNVNVGEQVSVQCAVRAEQPADASPDPEAEDEQEALEREMTLNAEDEEILEQAIQEVPEVSLVSGGQIYRAWFELWQLGLLEDNQVEVFRVRAGAVRVMRGSQSLPMDAGLETQLQMLRDEDEMEAGRSAALEEGFQAAEGKPEEDREDDQSRSQEEGTSADVADTALEDDAMQHAGSQQDQEAQLQCGEQQGSGSGDLSGWHAGTSSLASARALRAELEEALPQEEGNQQLPPARSAPADSP